jgi:hypothetical protein
MLSWRRRVSGVGVRIRLERAGGFAPAAMRREYTVEIDRLPPDQAREVQGLLDAAGVPDLAARATRGPSRSRPDMSYYRLVVEDGSRQHTVEMSDADIPRSLRSLIEWLMRHAAPGGP